MGGRQHHRRGRQLRFWQVDALSGHGQKTESAVGCDSFHGTSTIQSTWLGAVTRLIAGQDSFYKTLTPEQSRLAFANEYDFDSPEVYDARPLCERLLNEPLLKGNRFRCSGGPPARSQGWVKPFASHQNYLARLLTPWPASEPRFLFIRLRSTNAWNTPRPSTRRTCSYWKESLPCTTPGSSSSLTLE